LVECELRQQAGAGWEAQFFIDDEFCEFYRSRLFVTRRGAELWAGAERQAIETGAIASDD
jgi:hypothetical protein